MEFQLADEVLLQVCARPRKVGLLMNIITKQDLENQNEWMGEAIIENKIGLRQKRDWYTQIALVAELHELNTNLKQFLEKMSEPSVVIENLPSDYTGEAP